jgi:nucleotide-binding universal stress UspA family protein
MFERFLLAIDDSPASQVETSFAIALARQHQASVRVFHVNEYLFGGRGVTVESRAEASRLVSDVVDQLREAGIEASGIWAVATCFNVANRISEEAAQCSANAILLGSHRHRHLGRLFNRGVRERVTRVTSLPVLTAPSPLKLSRRRQGPATEARRLAPSATSIQG